MSESTAKSDILNMLAEGKDDLEIRKFMTKEYAKVGSKAVQEVLPQLKEVLESGDLMLIAATHLQAKEDRFIEALSRAVLKLDNNGPDDIREVMSWFGELVGDNNHRRFMNLLPMLERVADDELTQAAKELYPKKFEEDEC